MKTRKIRKTPPRGRKPAIVTRLRSLAREMDWLADWLDGNRRHTLNPKKR
jgi:hypothetical protein